MYKIITTFHDGTVQINGVFDDLKKAEARRKAVAEWFDMFGATTEIQ